MKNYEKENKTPKVKVLGEETLEEVKKEEKKVFRLKAIMDYLGNHKTQIIMILGALITLFTSLEVLGGKAAIYCTIIVAFIELVIFYIKNGLTKTFLEMCVNTVMLIVNAINGTYTVDKTVTVEKESRDADNNVKTQKRKKKIKVCILTEEMVRDYILTKEPIDIEEE